MKYLEKWRGRSVLVVDDSASCRFMAVQILKKLGIGEIYEAENGLDALKQLQTAPPVDLILTDLSMPVMDGIELLRVLGKTRRSHRVFIAVMSGVSQDVLDTIQSIADASMLAFLDVLPKPLTLAQITQLLGQCDPDAPLQDAECVDRRIEAVDVDAALQAGQLLPYFQPKIAIADRALRGMEALVRWSHPEHGILAPALFVHHLEQGDLALRFFYVFLDSVCAFLTRLPNTQQHIHCSINLPVPLLAQEHLVDEMVVILARHGLTNDRIVVELTETTLMSSLSDTLGTVARLRMKGFGVAMDDYGTGYSSMKQLSRCPFTELKIDREFVHDAANSHKKLTILMAAITMCQRLKLTSVAEGVETQQDWQQLAALGCDLAQGYLISRPLPADSFLAWMDDEGYAGTR